MESTTVIMQHVLKMQNISVLLKYIKWISRVVFQRVYMPCSLYKRLSTSVNSQTDKYQLFWKPSSSSCSFFVQENWKLVCRQRQCTIPLGSCYSEEKKFWTLYCIHSHSVSQGINKRENTRLFQAGQCHDTHSNFLSYCTAKGIE